MRYPKRNLASILAGVAFAGMPGLAQAEREHGHRGGVTVSDLSSSFQRLARATSPSVVQINVSGYTLTPESDENRVAALAREQGVGSGLILSEDGYIVTNAHVVHNAQKVVVTFHSQDALPALEDDPRAYTARVIGVDQVTDIALLKVERTGLPALTLGDSGAVRQGEIVVAFGSPLGLSNSMTMGMVSAPARQLHEQDLVQYIQTDAPINPGNSGGPLVNAAGEVVGMNTMILTQSGGSEGVGLAIPSNLVRTIVDQLKTYGHVHRGMIGANAQTVTPTLAEGLGLAAPEGVLITDLGPGGPGEEGGLKIGDVVLKMDGASLLSARQLELAVFRSQVGRILHLDLVREGEPKQIDVTIAERPDSSDSLTDLADPKDNLIPQLGIMAVTLDKKSASFNATLREPAGVVVAALAHEPTAWTTQLQPGDVIHAVNGAPVEELRALREKLAGVGAGKAVVLQIERDNGMRYIAFRAE